MRNLNKFIVSSQRKASNRLCINTRLTVKLMGNTYISELAGRISLHTSDDYYVRSNTYGINFEITYRNTLCVFKIPEKNEEDLTLSLDRYYTPFMCGFHPCKKSC
jgi:hypothetical protein